MAIVAARQECDGCDGVTNVVMAGARKGRNLFGKR